MIPSPRSLKGYLFATLSISVFGLFHMGYKLDPQDDAAAGEHLAEEEEVPIVVEDGGNELEEEMNLSDMEQLMLDYPNVPFEYIKIRPYSKRPNVTVSPFLCVIVQEDTIFKKSFLL